MAGPCGLPWRIQPTSAVLHPLHSTLRLCTGACYLRTPLPLAQPPLLGLSSSCASPVGKAGPVVSQRCLQTFLIALCTSSSLECKWPADPPLGQSCLMRTWNQDTKLLLHFFWRKLGRRQFCTQQNRKSQSWRTKGRKITWMKGKKEATISEVVKH